MGKAISTAFGAKVEEFTPTFKMLAGWVVELVREEQNIEAPHHSKSSERLYTSRRRPVELIGDEGRWQ